MLKLENIHTFYGAIQALNGVSVDVNKGEIVTLIGANGAGKTTLLMTVCGNPRAREGKITFEGEDITNKDTHHIMRSGIAISPEGRRVFKDLTVAENLMMGGFFSKRDEIEAGIDHVYGLFPRLKERASQRAGLMSGGEQQMLAIGRALMTRPRLLLLDEPTLGLAPLVIAQIFDIIPREGSGRIERCAFFLLPLRRDPFRGLVSLVVRDGGAGQGVDGVREGHAQAGAQGVRHGQGQFRAAQDDGVGAARLQAGDAFGGGGEGVFEQVALDRADRAHAEAFDFVVVRHDALVALGFEVPLVQAKL